MAEGNWNPWKMTAIGMALMMITALVTGLVVANWSGSEQEAKVTTPAPKASAPVASAPRPAPVRTAQATAPATPSQSTIEECNRQAASGQHDKTMEVVQDAAIGAVVGAGGGTLYGLNENKKQDERYRAAYGACMVKHFFTRLFR